MTEEQSKKLSEAVTAIMRAAAAVDDKNILNMLMSLMIYIESKKHPKSKMGSDLEGLSRHLNYENGYQATVEKLKEISGTDDRGNQK